MRKLEVRGLLAFILTVLLVLAPFPGGFAFADNTTALTATADATINQASLTSNYGASTTIHAAAPLTTAKRRTLVQFDVSSIPAAIKAAYLKMTLTATGAPAPSASTQAVHTVTNVWTEGTGTDAVPTTTDASWSNRTGTTAWTTAGGDYVATAVSTQSSGTANGALITWPVYSDGTNTNIVQKWKAGTLANNGLLVKDSTEPGNPLTFWETPTGTATGTIAAVSTSTALTASYGLFLAAIGKNNTTTVTSVSGGGLTFTYVGAQNNTKTPAPTGRIEIWYVKGTPTAGTVTATFPSATQAASIVVTRFTGFDPNSPLGTPAGAGAKASKAPTVNLTTTAANSFAYAAVYAEATTSTPPGTYTEDGEIGSANGADVVAQHTTSPIATPSLQTVSSTLSANAAWAILAVEIKQEVAPQYNSRTNAGTKPQLEVHYIADATGPSATSTVPSEVNLGWTMPTGGTYSGTSGALVVKRLGASATTFTPADANSSYTAGTTTGDGTSVLYRTDWTTGFTDENGADSVLAPSTQYTYKAWVRDDTTISGFGTAPYYAVGTAFATVTTSGVGSGTTKNWSYKTGAATLAPPGLNPSTGVITGGNDNKVHSMNASTGMGNYQPTGTTGITTGAIQSRPVVIPAAPTSSHPCACDVAYVGTGDGKVYAFNALTGVKLWTSPTLTTGVNAPIQGGVAVQVKAFSTGSSQTQDLVIVGTHNTDVNSATDNKVYGLNGNTGATVWTFSPGNMDQINSTPWVDYSTNTVWVTSRSNSGAQPSIWKINTNDGTGTGIPGLSTTNKDIDTSPTLNESTTAATFLYAVTLGNDLVAVRLSDNLVTTINVSGAAGGGAGFPIAIVNGTTAGSDDLYFTLSGASGGVYKYTFNRGTPGFSLGWSSALASPSAPIFNPNGTLAIYVGAADGKIHKYTTSGVDALTRTVSASATGDPSFDTVANKIYIGDANGRIYSFDVF